MNPTDKNIFEGTEEDVPFNFYEVLHTLSKTRNNREMEKMSGVSYSKLGEWYKLVEEDKKNHYYYIFFLLEYYRRIDEEAEKELIKKYNLENDVTSSFITQFIFPSKILESFVSSSVKWKKNIAKKLLGSNRALLVAQMKILLEFIEARYPHFKRESFNEKDTVDKLSDIPFIKHL